MKKLLVTIAIIAIAVQPLTVLADLLLFENFEATANGDYFGDVDVSGQWGSAGYTKSEAPISSSGDLDASGTDLMPSSGNGKLSMNSPTDTERGTLALAAASKWTNVVSGGLYTSFLLNVTDVAGLNTNWTCGDDILSLGSMGHNLFCMRNDENGGYVAAISSRTIYMGSDVRASADIPMTTNTVYLIVMGTDDVTSESNDAFKLWVNPVIDAAIPTPTTACKLSLTYTTFTSINMPNSCNQTNSSVLTDVYIDELRVGTSWDDVTPVPEPALLGLLALGILAWIRKKY